MQEQPEIYDKTFFGEFRKNLQIPYYRAGILALLGAELPSAPEEWKWQCFRLAESNALEIKDPNWRAQSLVGIAELFIKIGDIQKARGILGAVALLGVHYAEAQILVRIGTATNDRKYFKMAEIIASKINDPDLRDKALRGIKDAEIETVKK